MENVDKLIIRRATITDAVRLLEIYTPYVEDTAITFEYDVPSLEEFKNRIKTIGSKHPYLVAEKDGEIVGYAYANDFYGRAAYQWSVETTIYLDMSFRHHGIGRLLYTELEKELKSQGILNMNACITFANKPDEYLPLDSISFHKTMGFTECAHFHKSGLKFRRWYDVVWMEKMIGKHQESYR